MSENYGIEVPGPHHRATHRPPARWLVLIDAGGDGQIARLFDAARLQTGEVDAGTEEVAVMLKGITPSADASGAEWDAALAGHSAEARAAAKVYTLDV